MKTRKRIRKSNPRAGDVHVNRPLTNWAMMFLQNSENFIASRAMPNLPVDQQSDTYYKWAREDFLRDEAEEVADGAETKGSGYTLSTSPYLCKVYGWHKMVTDRQRKNADKIINLDKSAVNFVMSKLAIRRERQFASTYLGTSIWGTDMTGVASAPSGSQFIVWSAPTSDPIVDIRTGKRTILGRTGYEPNKMIIGQEAWDALLDNDAILDRITGGAISSQPAKVQRQLIASLFEIDQIFVSKAVYNSANKGATEATGFINADICLLYYAPDSIGGYEPTAGTQFSWTGIGGGASEFGVRMRRLRKEDPEADKVDGKMAYDYRVTASELGYYFTNCA